MRSMHVARLAFLLCAWTLAGTAVVAQPRLAVVIVIDQMRADYLDELEPAPDGGLGRLIGQGALFENAHHEHAITVTAAGHATISTGTHPSRHGVVGNDFWDRLAGESVPAVRDTLETMVGAERRSGRSPRRLLRSSVGDWLKARYPAAKVFGVSLKDRAAIFLAGQRPDGAYWYDERAGNFATSTYYETTLPDWVERFNGERRVERYFRTVWTGPGATPAFAHALGGPDGAPDRAFYTQFRMTPFADLVTLEFSRELIERESMGADGAPDLLLIGLSALDYIGHRDGPWSAEVRDAIRRLDFYLEGFLRYLDTAVGPEDYQLVLTSDHGVMPVAEELAARGVEAARVPPRELLDVARPLVEAAHARGDLEVMPRLRWRSGIVLDFGTATPSSDQLAALTGEVAAGLEQHPLVDAVFTYRQLLEGRGSDSRWLDAYRRSFHLERAADLFVHLRPNHLATGDGSGTGHGTPHGYDSHVPLVFWGQGIAAGRHSERVRTVDIAPTLASLLGIAAPADVDGIDLDLGQRAND